MRGNEVGDLHVALVSADIYLHSAIPDLLNSQNGMHTLCLLDIKVKEPDFATMVRGKISYLPPRYMTVGSNSGRSNCVFEELKGNDFTSDVTSLKTH